MITFTYLSKDYIFRNPELGNVDSLEFQRVNRVSRGGDRIVFRDNDWPTTETQNITFNFAEESDYRKLLNFIQLTVGQLCHYRDHENKLWYGFIQNPETAGSQTGRHSWVVSIVFEGDLV